MGYFLRYKNLTIISLLLFPVIYSCTKKEKIQQKNLQVCSELNFLPLSFKTAAGVPTGFEIEILKKYAQNNNLKINFVEVKWTEAIPALIAGKCDLIASGMSLTEERKKIALFSEPFYNIKDNLVIHKNFTQLNTFKEITEFDKKNIKIGVRQANEIDMYFKNNFKHAQILQYPQSDSDVISALLTGKVDAIGLHSTTAAIVVKSAKQKLEIFPKFIPTGTFPISYVMRNDEIQLKNSIDTFLKNFILSDEYKNLEKEFF